MRNRFLRISLSLAVFIAGALGAIAQTSQQTNCFATKLHFYYQGNASLLLEDSQPWAFNAEVTTSNSATSASLRFPDGKSIKALPKAGAGHFRLQKNFPTKAAMDAEFPNGIYTFVLKGASFTATRAVAVTGDHYPSAEPRILAADFAYGALTVDASQPLTLTWSNFRNFSRESHVVLTISDPDSNFVLQQDYNTPATSCAIPAGTLQSGKVYDANVDFSNSRYIWQTQTDFKINTGALSGSNPLYATRSDMDGNGTSDILVRNSKTGATQVLFLNSENSGVLRSAGPVIPSNLTLFGAIDINGDGVADWFFYRPSTHRVEVWLMNRDLSVSGTLVGPQIASGWTPGVVIFAYQHKPGSGPDVLVPAIGVYQGSTGRTKALAISVNGPSLAVKLLGDGPVFPRGCVLEGTVISSNHDTQLVVLNTATEALEPLSSSKNGASTTVQIGPTIPHGWSVCGINDYLGIGKPSVFIYNPATKKTRFLVINKNEIEKSIPGPTLPVGYTPVDTY